MGEQPQHGGVRLPEVTTPSEKTVQQIAASGTGRGRTRRRTWRKKGAVSARLDYHISVRNDVWEEACSLTEDPRNIQIVNDEEVIVWNHGPPWPR